MTTSTERYPFVVGDPKLGFASLAPFLPITLLGTQAVSVIAHRAAAAEQPPNLPLYGQRSARCFFSGRGDGTALMPIQVFLKPPLECTLAGVRCRIKSIELALMRELAVGGAE